MSYYYQYTNGNYKQQPAYYWSHNIDPAQGHCPEMRCRNIAVANIQGGPLAPTMRGTMYFVRAAGGTNVYVEVSGLPPYSPAVGNASPIGPHGFHIHQNGTCEVGDPADPFQAAGGHWNPTNQPHGNHAGDFPVLFSNDGVARMWFYTNKFNVEDVIGKSVIIHQNPDDYRTQPAGNSGKKLACGVIRWY